LVNVGIVDPRHYVSRLNRYEVADLTDGDDTQNSVDEGSRRDCLRWIEGLFSDFEGGLVDGKELQRLVGTGDDKDLVRLN
jgi:hypothetical protein